MGTKIDLNKQQKKETLLNTAFHLFTTKGINKTSISEIAEASGIAKGTFYLYFTDTYEINGGVDSVDAGDTLVFGTDGLIVKGTSDGYKVYFEVIEKTAYMGKGILAVIRVQ